MEYSDIWILTEVENWARTPPMLLPVDPLPCADSRSITKTFLHPAAVKWYAMLEPTMPPPMRTTSAVRMSSARRTEHCSALGSCGVLAREIRRVFALLRGPHAFKLRSCLWAFAQVLLHTSDA